MPQLKEWEFWAVALKVLEMHGPDVGDFLSERVQSMMDSGNEDGLAHWIMIAVKVNLLREPDDHSRMN